VVFDCFLEERGVPVFFKMRRDQQVTHGGLLFIIGFIWFFFLCIWRLSELNIVGSCMKIQSDNNLRHSLKQQWKTIWRAIYTQKKH
jgi:hypothetical protein